MTKKKYLYKTIIIILFSFPLNLFSKAGDETKIISIETSSLNMIFKQDSLDNLFFLYFGEKIVDKEMLLKKHFLKRPDTNEEFTPSGYLAYGGRVYLEPALKVTHNNGSLTTELKVIGSEILQSEDVKTTIIHLKDRTHPLYVDLIFDAYQKEDVITQRVKIINREEHSILLENFYSSYIPVQAQKYYLTHFHGTWAKEMQLSQTLLSSGIKSIESKKGVRTTQSENPSFILSVNQQAKAYEGEVYMGSLAWSGNFKLNFELDETNQLNILSGINPFGSRYYLKKYQEFITPEMIWTYSSHGYNPASRNLHKWALKHRMHQGDKINEIVLNSWEGAYFNFDEETLKSMIDNASRLGVEVFVLDDGWFGNNFPRNADNAGLGDWQVNREKLPNGINNLAKYAKSKNLKFGIWIEPEMVNPKSDLANNHPDWIVKSPGREIPTLRNQWLLDLSNPEVQDFIYNTFNNVLALSEDITYVKWDANRHVESVGSDYLPQDEQSRFWIEYVHGLYSVYERIRKKHPDVIIQLCSSGGGRVDYGAFKFHDEFWASDNTDPYTRIYLQYATNLFFPPQAMASHVTIIPNHQTGSISPLKLRFDVAMMGRLGLELQPKDLTQEELNFIKKAIQSYKEVRHIVQFGELYQIWSPYQEGKWSSTIYVSNDKKEILFFAFSLDFHERTIMPTFKLQGLDPNTSYKITELNQFGKEGFWGNNQIFTGEYLMKVGINPNIQLRGESIVLHLEKTHNFGTK